VAGRCLGVGFEAGVGWPAGTAGSTTSGAGAVGVGPTAMIGFDAAGVGTGVASGVGAVVGNGVAAIPGSVVGAAGAGVDSALGSGTFATGAGVTRGVRIG
jgi:hypothetical protein